MNVIETAREGLKNVRTRRQRVIAEQQPDGSYLLMTEDGDIDMAVSKAAALTIIKRRARSQSRHHVDDDRVEGQAMNMQQLTTFITHTIGGLPEDKRNAVRVLFHNPTDAAIVVFEQFAEWGGLETLAGIIETAENLGIDHADYIGAAFLRWQHEDDDACPTCGNHPGDGPGCSDPNGCGFGVAFTQ